MSGLALALALVQAYDSDSDADADRRAHDDDQEQEQDQDQEQEQEQERAEADEPSAFGVFGDLAKRITPLGATTAGSGLPSAADVFSEVTGPPEFLRPAALQPIPSRKASRSSLLASQPSSHGGAVITAKPQRAAPSVGGPKVGEPTTPSSQGRAAEPSRTISVQMPPIQDAAHLLSLCDTCQLPKTFSAARGGMVCPQCSDRPVPADGGADGGLKKRGGFVKDKEKIKRMKGQSTHATWKSETEMQLRQTFD